VSRRGGCDVIDASAGFDALLEPGLKCLAKPLVRAIPLQRFVPNGEIVIPVEAALDLAPQARKRHLSYKQIRVPRRDIPKKSP
jgi:hypothetical protein